MCEKKDYHARPVVVKSVGQTMRPTLAIGFDCTWIFGHRSDVISSLKVCFQPFQFLFHKKQW